MSPDPGRTRVGARARRGGDGTRVPTGHAAPKVLYRLLAMISRLTTALLLVAGCHRSVVSQPPPALDVEPLPSAPFVAAEAAAATRVPDPARGGPAIHEGASPLPPFLGVDRSTARYVGSETCTSCHPDAGLVWSGSAHARAYATLEAQQSAFNPSCFRCHVTGYGHPGGFTRAPALVDVGCEACHGPGSDHIAAPAAGFGDLPKETSACVACHTHDTSPDFVFGERWGKIAH